MKCLNFELVVWLAVVLSKYGFTQECRFTHKIQSSGLESININIQDLPTCFICPVITESFTLNLNQIMNAPPDVIIENSTLIINNWSAVPLATDNINTIYCNGTGSTTIYTTFFHFTRVCGVNHLIGSTSFIPIDVNITNTPICFTCPNVASSFVLNENSLTNVYPDIIIINSTVIIYNWTAVPLTLSDVNRISCLYKDDILQRTTLFYSLTPGPLILQRTQRFYIEEEDNISVLCVNPNMRPGYNTQNASWRNSSGHVVSEQRQLILSATRNNAGIYTCSIPSVPLIPSAMFEVVIIYTESTSTVISTVTILVNTSVVSGDIDYWLPAIIGGVAAFITILTILPVSIIFIVKTRKGKGIPLKDNRSSNFSSDQKDTIETSANECYGLSTVTTEVLPEVAYQELIQYGQNERNNKESETNYTNLLAARGDLTDSTKHKSSSSDYQNNCQYEALEKIPEQTYDVPFV